MTTRQENFDDIRGAGDGGTVIDPADAGCSAGELAAQPEARRSVAKPAGHSAIRHWPLAVLGQVLLAQVPVLP